MLKVTHSSQRTAKTPGSKPNEERGLLSTIIAFSGLYEASEVILGEGRKVTITLWVLLENPRDTYMANTMGAQREWILRC